LGADFPYRPTACTVLIKNETEMAVVFSPEIGVIKTGLALELNCLPVYAHTSGTTLVYGSTGDALGSFTGQVLQIELNGVDTSGA
jgi:hypothetical protein